jgi:hypothetical protein
MQLDLFDYCSMKGHADLSHDVYEFPALAKLTTIQTKPDVSKEVDVYAWSDDGIIVLMDCMVHVALRKIRDGAYNSTAFAEEVVWLYACSHQERPFSASNCARVAGLDLECIRRSTMRALPEQKVQIIRMMECEGSFS